MPARRRLGAKNFGAHQMPVPLDGQSGDGASAGSFRHGGTVPEPHLTGCSLARFCAYEAFATGSVGYIYRTLRN